MGLEPTTFSWQRDALDNVLNNGIVNYFEVKGFLKIKQ